MKSVIATQRVFRVRAGLGQKKSAAIWLRTAALKPELYLLHAAVVWGDSILFRRDILETNFQSG